MRAKLTQISIIVFLLSFMSCKKQQNDPQNKTFTECPPNTTCSYLYVNNADLRSYEVVSGKYRVFQAKFRTDYSTTTFHFKADLLKTGFYISDANIKAGAIKYVFACLACDWIGIKPAGGYVKGTKVGNSRWLIDGVVIMKAEHGLNYSDTVSIKQYFNVAKDTRILID